MKVGGEQIGSMTSAHESDSAREESCSCVEGNACVVSYNCRDWSRRFGVAKAARDGKPTA